MNILVTGGLGFIGSHLVTELLKNPDAHVVAVDNLSNTVLTREELVREITADAAGTLQCVVDNVENYTPPDDLSFNAIFHLASIVGPAAVIQQSGRITQSIVRDVYRMIKLAQQHDARLTFVSTSEVYGGGKDGYCEEETPRVFRGEPSARQEYAAAKLACEIAIGNLCRAGELDAVIIRPFNVAGVRQQGRGGFVLPRFVGQVLHGIPLTVFGTGEQLRAFTDVRDVASGICIAHRRGNSGEVFNVGNPKNCVSINRLADCVLCVTDSSEGKIHLDPRSLYGPTYADAPDKFPNARALLKLGWTPQYTLHDTVSDVFQWFQTLPRERVAGIAGLRDEVFAKVQT